MNQFRYPAKRHESREIRCATILVQLDKSLRRAAHAQGPTDFCAAMDLVAIRMCAALYEICDAHHANQQLQKDLNLLVPKKEALSSHNANERIDSFLHEASDISPAGLSLLAELLANPELRRETIPKTRLPANTHTLFDLIQRFGASLNQNIDIVEALNWNVGPHLVVALCQTLFSMVTPDINNPRLSEWLHSRSAVDSAIAINNRCPTLSRLRLTQPEEISSRTLMEAWAIARISSGRRVQEHETVKWASLFSAFGLEAAEIWDLASFFSERQAALSS